MLAEHKLACKLKKTAIKRDKHLFFSLNPCHLEESSAGFKISCLV